MTRRRGVRIRGRRGGARAKAKPAKFAALALVVLAACGHEAADQKPIAPGRYECILGGTLIVRSDLSWSMRDRDGTELYASGGPGHTTMVEAMKACR